MEISQIHEAVNQGDQVLLLVSLQQMLGYDVPHWILCHGTAGSAEHPVILIEDSWVDVSSAESWVDATCLPITFQELDAMSCLEEDGYQYALILTGELSNFRASSPTTKEFIPRPEMSCNSRVARRLVGCHSPECDC